MTKKLKIWQGYTVDGRLKEFRKVRSNRNSGYVIEFVSFDSRKGKKLLRELNKNQNKQIN